MGGEPREKKQEAFLRAPFSRATLLRKRRARRPLQPGVGLTGFPWHDAEKAAHRKHLSSSSEAQHLNRRRSISCVG